MLDEFVTVTGYHRKHAIRVLRRCGRREAAKQDGRQGKRIYDEAVRQVLVMLWEASDWICGKRLKLLLSVLVEAMERHGHLRLELEVRRRVLAVSASTWPALRSRPA